MVYVCRSHWFMFNVVGGKARDRQVVIRILEARLTPPWETLIILVNQAGNPAHVGSIRAWIRSQSDRAEAPQSIFQNGHGSGMREDVRRLPMA